MSNHNRRNQGRSCAVVLTLIVSLLSSQYSRACACRVSDTPCTNGCPCAVQRGVFEWQCSHVAIPGGCKSNCSSDMTRHSHDIPNRECECRNGPPIAVTKVTTHSERDLECRMLLDWDKMANRSSTFRLSISEYVMPNAARCTSLQRCVAICRLTL